MDNVSDKVSCTSAVENVEDPEIIENHLVTYLQNVLKYQILPMDFMSLRNLIKDAPQNLKLYDFVEKKYPGQEFLSFLKKYPAIFIVNSDNSVQSTASTYCIQSSKNTTAKSCDEVDSYDRGEYISDEESD